MAELRKKMLAAYAEINNPPLDSTNPHFKSKFSSLKASFEAVREVCVSHGFAYAHHEQRSADGQYLVSLCYDEDEEIVLSEALLPTFTDPQKKGIWLTYLKRQQTQSDWLIVGEEDTDGEGISTPDNPKTQVKQQQPQQAIPDDMYRTLQKRFQLVAAQQSIKATDFLSQLNAELGFELSANMNQAQYNAAMALLEKKAVPNAN